MTTHVVAMRDPFERSNIDANEVSAELTASVFIALYVPRISSALRKKINSPSVGTETETSGIRNLHATFRPKPRHVRPAHEKARERTDRRELSHGKATTKHRL